MDQQFLSSVLWYTNQTAPTKQCILLQWRYAAEDFLDLFKTWFSDEHHGNRVNNYTVKPRKLLVRKILYLNQSLISVCRTMCNWKTKASSPKTLKKKREKKWKGTPEMGKRGRKKVEGEIYLKLKTLLTKCFPETRKGNKHCTLPWVLSLSVILLIFLSRRAYLANSSIILMVESSCFMFWISALIWDSCSASFCNNLDI